MQEAVLKNGKKILIRNAVKADAAALIQYMDQVSRESDFLTFGPGENPLTLEQEEQYIEQMNSRSNAMLLLAEEAGKMIACISFAGGVRKRTAHMGEFGITVLQPYWETGVGTALLHAMLRWAKASGVVRKINLKVRTDNQRAIYVYQKLGFEIEGRLSRDMLIAGRFYDAYYMGICIDG